jgi:hypothetical protein
VDDAVGGSGAMPGTILSPGVIKLKVFVNLSNRHRVAWTSLILVASAAPFRSREANSRVSMRSLPI